MELFDATLVEAPRGGAYVAVPAEVVAALGGSKRVPVRATFDGIAKKPATRQKRIAETVTKLGGASPS
jgi:hypothetical protein